MIALHSSGDAGRTLSRKYLHPEWEPETAYLHDDRAKQIIDAFERLENRNRDIVSLHLGFCERCGRPREKLSFGALANRNGLRSAQAAENLYYKSLDQMKTTLIESGLLHTLRIKHIETKKAAAVYAYLADNGGDWGEIVYDFETDTFTVTKPAERDNPKSLPFAEKAFHRIRKMMAAEEPKEKDYVLFEL